MTKQKLDNKWTTIPIAIGNPDTAPARRAAYLRAAEEAGYKSFSAWARLCLDSAARYADPVKLESPPKTSSMGPADANPAA